MPIPLLERVRIHTINALNRKVGRPLREQVRRLEDAEYHRATMALRETEKHGGIILVTAKSSEGDKLTPSRLRLDPQKGFETVNDIGQFVLSTQPSCNISVVDRCGRALATISYPRPGEKTALSSFLYF